MLLLITFFSIDVGTLILAPPGLHAQVASYKMMSCFERRKDLAKSKVPLSDLISYKYPKLGYWRVGTSVLGHWPQSPLGQSKDAAYLEKAEK